MLVINIQTAAEQDLIDIWLYTYHQWSEDQADHYIDILNTRDFKRLQEIRKLELTTVMSVMVTGGSVFGIIQYSTELQKKH